MKNKLSVLKEDKVKKAKECLRALEHDLRMDILKYIDKNPGTFVKNIYKSLDLEQSVTSQHLKILKDAGFVIAERQGKNIMYSVNYDRIKLVIDSVSAFVD